MHLGGVIKEGQEREKMVAVFLLKISNQITTYLAPW